METLATVDGDFNDGTVSNANNQWSLAEVPLPVESDEYRVDLQADIDPAVNRLAVDGVKVTTNQRCDPRWIKVPGYEIDLAKAATLAPLDEAGLYDRRDLVEKKHYAASKTGFSLPLCAHFCYSGSGCDMFDYDSDSNECNFLPHSDLKGRHWFEYAVKSADVNRAIYVLQCSTARENVLSNSDLNLDDLEHWQVNSNCPTWGLEYPSDASDGQKNDFRRLLSADCDAGNYFKISTLADRFPLGMNADYLDKLSPNALLKFRLRTRDKVALTQDSAIQHVVQIKSGIEAPVDVTFNEPENEEFYEYSKLIDDLADDALNEEFYIRFTAQDRDAKLELIPSLELLVDTPIDLGCFVDQGLSLSGLTIVDNPAACLAHCYPANRVAITRFGAECYCKLSMDMDKVTPVENSKCDRKCDADPGQFCGGPNANYVKAFAGSCPPGQVRFGDHCYFPINGVQPVTRNSDYCEEMGMHLWFPESRDEIDFIRLKYSAISNYWHVGYRSFQSHDGILHSDNSIGIGLPGITHDPNTWNPLIPSSDYINDAACLTTDTANGGSLTMHTPCIAAKAICKARVSASLVREILSGIEPEFYYPRLAGNPLEFAGINPYHLELKDFLYSPEKRLEIEFPLKVVLTGISVETQKGKHLQSFSMAYAKTAFVAPEEFTPVALRPDSPAKFYSFDDDSLSAEGDLLKRDIMFPWPILAQRFRLIVVDGSADVVVKLDFFGRTAGKQNSGEGRLEPTLFHYDIPHFNYADDASNQFPIPAKICPNGEIYLRGKFRGDLYSDPQPLGTEPRM